MLAPVILVAIVILALALGALTIVFKRLGLANRREAMGLPEGSIRAILALLLVLLFLVLSLYLFGQLKQGEPVRPLQGLTAAQADGIPLDQQLARLRRGGTDAAPLYDVTLRPVANPTVDNFALQLLTTMSTLVVAVAAFYFGSSAVKTGYGAGAETKRIEEDAGAAEAKRNEDAGAAEAKRNEDAATAEAKRNEDAATTEATRIEATPTVEHTAQTPQEPGPIPGAAPTPQEPARPDAAPTPQEPATPDAAPTPQEPPTPEAAPTEQDAAAADAARAEQDAAATESDRVEDEGRPD